MTKKNICVLLATHNGVRYLHDQLDSILAQKDVTCDIYVSDDCSTDGTLDLIKRYVESHPSIFLLPNRQNFGCAAFNFYHLFCNVQFDPYDYIALSDQDDIWNAKRLVNAVHIIDETGSDAYSSNVTAFWSNGREKLLVKSKPQRRYDFLFEPAGPGCTYVLKADAANSIKSFILSASGALKFPKHDWLIYSIARSLNKKWFIDPVPSLMYRQHSVNEVGANVGIYAAVKRLKILRRGDYLGNVYDLCLILDINPCIYFSRSSVVTKFLFIKNIFYSRRDLCEGLFLVLMIVFGFAKAKND